MNQRKEPKNFEDRCMTITLRTGSGTPIRDVELVRVSEIELRRTHNRTTFFKYQVGYDASGNKYDKRPAGTWREVRQESQISRVLRRPDILGDSF